MRHFIRVLLVCSGLAVLAAAAPAEARHYHSGVSVNVGWSSGYWYRGWHGGRGGWWWVVGPGWYYYPEPVYPYPERVIVEREPVMTGPPPAQSWYYCRESDAYFPYVSSCAAGWEQVPATPPPPPPPSEKEKAK